MHALPCANARNETTLGVDSTLLHAVNGWAVAVHGRGAEGLCREYERSRVGRFPQVHVRSPIKIATLPCAPARGETEQTSVLSRLGQCQAAPRF